MSWHISLQVRAICFSSGVQRVKRLEVGSIKPQSFHA